MKLEQAAILMVMTMLTACRPPVPVAVCSTRDDCPANQQCDIVRGYCFSKVRSPALDATADAVAADSVIHDVLARDSRAPDAAAVDAAAIDAATVDAVTADAVTGDSAPADTAIGDGPSMTDATCASADAGGGTCPQDVVCPAAYVRVSGSPAAGSWPCDFCVAKYEMKAQQLSSGAIDDGLNLSGSIAHQAASSVEQRPWTGLALAEARQRCARLGAGFHLITNAEWMTIARDIASTASNWSSDQVGSGAVNSGHSDCSAQVGISYAAAVAVETDFLAAGADDAPCTGTGNPSCTVFGHPDFGQKRTHQLSNGERIWDLVGNVNEWVDVDGCGGLLEYQGSNGNEFVELDSAEATTAYRHMAPLASSDFLPAVTGVSGNFASAGFGKIRVAWGAALHQGRALFRSGKYGENCQGTFTPGEGNHRVGIFTAWISYGPDERYGNLGFRCGYRP